MHLSKEYNYILAQEGFFDIFKKAPDERIQPLSDVDFKKLTKFIQSIGMQLGKLLDPVVKQIKYFQYSKILSEKDLLNIKNQFVYRKDVIFTPQIYKVQLDADLDGKEYDAMTATLYELTEKMMALSSKVKLPNDCKFTDVSDEEGVAGLSLYVGISTLKSLGINVEIK
jgi:hypothetical protein